MAAAAAPLVPPDSLQAIAVPVMNSLVSTNKVVVDHTTIEPTGVSYHKFKQNKLFACKSSAALRPCDIQKKDKQNIVL